MALAIVAVAAFAAAVKFSADLRLGRGAQSNGGVVREGDTPGSPPRFSASDYRQSRFPPSTGQPLIGVNYTHYAFPNCSLIGTGILRTYSNPGIARIVHAQLFQMRNAGVATIRTIIWHMTDATGQSWGAVSSGGGRLHEPYRTNLIRYLMEVKKFRFAHLTVSLAPQGINDPRLPIYQPGKFAENWRFIKTVRSLLKRYGPARTRIDLMNEGAPSETPSQYFPVPWQVGRYLRAIYRLYVRQFGNRDVLVSAISPTQPADTTNRLQTLVRILKSTDQPLPRWYEVHIGYDSAKAAYSLRNADVVLNQERQYQPLVIGETAYDDGGVARSIKKFRQSSSRRIDEVSPWYLRRAKGCQVTPPYTPGAYGRELHPHLAR